MSATRGWAVLPPVAHLTGAHSPMLLVAVGAAAAAYIWMARRPRARMPLSLPESRLQRRRGMLFAAALLAALVALFGPIDRFAGELFWVHMVQHVLLLTVVAPLIVLSAPWVLMLRLLPPGTHRRVYLWWRQQQSKAGVRRAMFFATPTAAWIVFDANLLVWHVPAIFDLTLRNPGVHIAEHLLFLATGVLFWAQVIDTPLMRTHMTDLARVAYVEGAATVGWILSVALTVAPSALYAGYAGLPGRPGGLSALSDQRIAASVMLVPGSITFLIAGVVYLLRWLDGERGEMKVQPRLPEEQRR
jgi:putative membrane protein